MAYNPTTSETPVSDQYAIAAAALNLNLPDGGFFRGRPVGDKTVQRVQQLSGGYWVTCTDRTQDVIRYADCA